MALISQFTLQIMKTRDVEITYNVISDQDQVQAIYFDLSSAHRQINFLIFLPAAEQAGHGVMHFRCSSSFPSS